MRQTAIFDRRRVSTAQITALSHDYRSGHRVPTHFHEVDQLVFAALGVMTIETPDGVWVVPPQRAVWVPARTRHSIRMSGAVAMKTIYLKPRLAKHFPRRCCVVHVSPLLREMVVHTCERGLLDHRKKIDASWIAILLDQLRAATASSLELPLPRDPRALRVARAAMASPSDRRTLEKLCERSGASKRTIERCFRVETKLTFGRWRQQLSLLHAIRLLAAGNSVTTVALEVGYATPSAFIAMFRGALGETPAHYFK
jgi:AraC-like DNA-binding protein